MTRTLRAHQQVAGQAPDFAGATIWRDLIVTSGIVAPEVFRGPVDVDDEIVGALGELDATLRRAGGALHTVLRVDAFLADAALVAHWNRAFGQTWQAPRPARTTLITGFVAPTINVEISVLAYRLDEPPRR